MSARKFSNKIVFCWLIDFVNSCQSFKGIFCSKYFLYGIFGVELSLKFLSFLFFIY